MKGQWNEFIALSWLTLAGISCAWETGDFQYKINSLLVEKPRHLGVGAGACVWG